MEAAAVLSNGNLFKLVTRFQNGLPIALVELVKEVNKATSVTFADGFDISFGEHYLSNIPQRFQHTPYLKLFKRWDSVPCNALFLNGLYEHPNLPFHLSIVENNIKHVEQWIQIKPEWLTPAPLKLAAACGHLDIVKMLMCASKSVWTSAAMDLAAMNGYLDVVKYLHNLDNGPGCTTSAMNGAAAFGHLQVVQFLHDNRTEGCTFKAVAGAISNGYSGVVEYLLKHRNEHYGNGIFLYAEYYEIQSHRRAQGQDYIGLIQCLQRHAFHYPNPLQSLGILTRRVDEDVIVKAIEMDPVPILKYVYQEEIYGMTKIMLDKLIELGDYEAIRYALQVILTENNMPISLLDNDNSVAPWTPQNKAFTSEYYKQKWIDSEAIDIACRLGNLEVVKLLHRSGIHCCTPKAMNYAAAIGRLDIVEWLHSHRTEGCTYDAIVDAAANGHFRVVQWLHDTLGLKCPDEWQIVANLYTIPTNESREFNTWQDVITIDDVLDAAIADADLDKVKDLCRYRHARCSRNAFRNATTSQQIKVMDFIIAHEYVQDGVDYEELCVETAACENFDMMELCLSQVQEDLSTKSKQFIMYKAATCASIGFVQWLHEDKGFGWTLAIQQRAQERRRVHIVRYFDNIGNPQTNVLDDEEFALSLNVRRTW